MEITLLYRLSEICVASKGMVFEPFMSQKGIDFDHINVHTAIHVLKGQMDFTFTC